MKKLLLGILLVGSMSLLFFACEPVEGDFGEPLDEPMEQENGF